MNTKIILLPENEEKSKKKERVIIEKENWTFEDHYYDASNQYLLFDITNDEFYNKVLCGIKNKIHSYKQQDKIKKIYDKQKIITVQQVMFLLNQCQHICYYCKECVCVLYKNVREPKQWTLERINNDYGHNHDNVVISCLSCNVRRRTMYHERYVFTKQLVVKKI